MKKNLICINCPQGCRLQVDYTDTAIERVEGNKCKRGITYAETELFNPVRMVTTTMRIDNACIPQVPVKTQQPVPRDCTLEIIKEISRICLKAPVKVGDVVLENVLATGVSIVATRSLGREEVNQNNREGE